MKLERVTLRDEGAIEEWDSFVESHPSATPYHLSNWLKTIHETYSFDPLLILARENNGSLAGIFPSFGIRRYFSRPRVVSIPFSDYGGPLLSNSLREADFLLRLREQFPEKLKCLEIRGGLQSPEMFTRYDYYKRHTINLQSGIDAIRDRIDKKTILYSIRKAERAGVEVRQENSRLALKEFCRLNALTRKKHGMPTQPRFFFENLFDSTVVKNRAFIVVARHESRAIAASFFLIVGKMIHYKYSASDPYYVKTFAPNHLLTWSVINWGASQGYHELDFGRTSPDNIGLIRYKNMWGMEDVDLPYYYYPKIKGAASTKERGRFYRCFTSLWRHLPFSVTELLGAHFYRFLG
jgi:CelD/BcsL family acetyltransferase involved in cellulose biosynthesis